MDILKHTETLIMYADNQMLFVMHRKKSRGIEVQMVPQYSLILFILFLGDATVFETPGRHRHLELNQHADMYRL